MQLQGKRISLRPTASPDIDILHVWENDRSNWDVSNTKKSFTKKEIEGFITNQKDIYLDKQLRLMIQKTDNKQSTINNPLGCIDLFDFDTQKAGVGILIEESHRKNGYASEALELLIKYSFEILHLKELYCNISEENKASMNLFQKHMFKIIERKKNLYSLTLVNNATNWHESH